MRYICRLLLIMVLGISGAQAQSELEIIIDTGVENALPIAVIPFGWNGIPDAATD